MRNRNEDIGNSGFSLIEITLALLVIAVGLLAVFGLLGDSIKANSESLDDTIAASFAESVFDSVFASDWTSQEYDVLMGANSFWEEDPTNIFLCASSTDININKYVYNAIDYYPLKYNLLITRQGKADGSETTSSTPSEDYVWRALCLKVWIGEFADTSANSTPYEFYTEQYRFIDPKKEYEQNQNP